MPLREIQGEKQHLGKPFPEVLISGEGVFLRTI